MEQLRAEGNPDALLNLLRVFDVADGNDDGIISRDELASVAANLGYDLSEAAIDAFSAQAIGTSTSASPTAAAGATAEAFLSNIRTATMARAHKSAEGIAFDEFVTLVLSLERREPRTAARAAVTARAARLFGFFDVDGHGVLDTAGMTQRLQQIGKEIDTAGTEQLFVDITGMPQGTVSRDEFTSYLVSSDFRV